MSDKHTPEHTKEPWFYEPGYSYRDPSLDKTQWGAYGICDANDAVSVTTHLENDEANARRIVACVNACIGIDTDYLETIVREGGCIDNEVRQRIIGKNAAERAAKAAEQQRDELLAAAIAVVERWDTPLWKDVPATGEYINRLRAASAKVKP